MNRNGFCLTRASYSVNLPHSNMPGGLLSCFPSRQEFILTGVAAIRVADNRTDRMNTCLRLQRIADTGICILHVCTYRRVGSNSLNGRTLRVSRIRRQAPLSPGRRQDKRPRAAQTSAGCPSRSHLPLRHEQIHSPPHRCSCPLIPHISSTHSNVTYTR